MAAPAARYHPHGLFGIAHNLYARVLYQKHGIQSLFTGADIIFLMPLLRRLMTWWGPSIALASGSPVPIARSCVAHRSLVYVSRLQPGLRGPATQLAAAAVAT